MNEKNLMSHVDAEEEADKLRQKIESGEARNYNRAEKQVEDEKRTVWLSLEDSMARTLPFFDSEKAEEMIREKPNFYGDQHWRSREETAIIRVNMEEYFNFFSKIIEDDEVILKYVEKFNPEFIDDLVKHQRISNASLDNQEDRLTLARYFLGISDHDDWSVKYKCSDEEYGEWFKENIIKNYRIEGEHFTERVYSDISYIFYLLGGKIFQFTGAGDKLQQHEFPTGGEYDKLQFEEMKRIKDLIINNPDVVSLEMTLGVGVPIRPTWIREKKD